MEISLKRLHEYRSRTYRTSPGLRLSSPRQAVDFVNERGFIFLWPIKGVELPSLWDAVAGDRPVADDHDDPGHISWAWKDQMLDQRVWYYARLLKHRNVFVSLELAPYFYALTPNYGSPEEDFYEQYQQGEIPLEAKLIFEALLKEGPLDTLSLRKAAHLSGKGSDTPFNRALDLLQVEMKCLPVSVCEAGRWHYAFVYDLTHRYYPDLSEKARPISEKQARKMLLQSYLDSVGMASAHQIASLFHWSGEITAETLASLTQANLIQANLNLEKQKDLYFASNKLL